MGPRASRSRDGFPDDQSFTQLTGSTHQLQYKRRDDRRYCRAQIQQGFVVPGIEGDLDWTSVKGNGISTPTILGVPQPTTRNLCSQQLDRSGDAGFDSLQEIVLN